jgi:hypothetical protein
VAKKYKYFVVSRAACHSYTSSIADIDTEAKALSRGSQQSVGTVSGSDERKIAGQTIADNLLLGEQFKCELKQGSSGQEVDDSSSGLSAADGTGTKKFNDEKKRLRGEFVIEYDATDRAGNKAQQLVFAMIMVDLTPPVITRHGDVTQPVIQACDMDKAAIYRNDVDSRNKVTTNEREIYWTDNFDGVTPYMSAAGSTVRANNLYYKYTKADTNSEGVVSVQSDIAVAASTSSTTNYGTQAFFDSFTYADQTGAVSVKYYAKDYANIFGDSYEDNVAAEADNADPWTIKDSIPPRVVQRFSNSEPHCPAEEDHTASADARCKGGLHNGPTTAVTSRWSSTETAVTQSKELSGTCAAGDKLVELATGAQTLGDARKACQCWNFRRSWGTTTTAATLKARKECVAYDTLKLYSAHTAGTGTCMRVNVQSKTLTGRSTAADIPVTYFECGNPDGYKEMGFKCIDIRDSFATSAAESAPYKSAYTATDSTASDPTSYFVKTQNTHLVHKAVEYRHWSSSGEGTVINGTGTTASEITDFQAYSDGTDGYGTCNAVKRFYSEDCIATGGDEELPLFVHGAAFIATYSCTDKAGNDNNVNTEDHYNKRITKVVDTLAPTLRINAQGMEQINTLTASAYGLDGEDNSQNAFSDKDTDRRATGLAGTSVLKKMNSHYHSDKLNGGANWQVAGNKYYELKDELGNALSANSESTTKTCDRSGKTWRNDWKNHTRALGHHLRDDTDSNWAVDSYVIQHSAGFDADEDVIMNIEKPYIGYSCFDQCDGDLTHTAGDETAANTPITNTAHGVTLTWHDLTCSGTVKSNGFETLKPGTYALKYSCEDQAGHITTKCRTILNEDHTKPIITVLEADQQTYEATRSDNYVDAGATCSDEVDGNISQDVEVSGDVVNLARVGVYTIKYNCQDSAANTADEATRTVVVQDTSCPACVITPDGGQATDTTHATQGETVSIEASFPYNDVGAVATDSLQGSFGICSVWSNGVLKANYKEIVNVESTGTYHITYRVKDSNGNWNDASGCTGGQTAKQNVRTVVIIDTLRPVIQLKYNNAVIHEGAASFATGASNANRGDATLTHTNVDSTGDAVHLATGVNPAHTTATTGDFTHTWSEASNALMAEQATTSSVNGWVVGAVGSAVTGLALLGYSLRKSAAPVATSVPV